MTAIARSLAAIDATINQLKHLIAHRLAMLKPVQPSMGVTPSGKIQPLPYGSESFRLLLTIESPLPSERKKSSGGCGSGL